MEIIFHSTELFSGSIYLKSLTNGTLEQYFWKKTTKRTRPTKFRIFVIAIEQIAQLFQLTDRAIKCVLILSPIY